MPITEKNRYRYYSETYPRCPHCDFDMSDNTSLYSDGIHHLFCPECLEYIFMTVELEYRFSTDHDENIKERKHKGKKHED